MILFFVIVCDVTTCITVHGVPYIMYIFVMPFRVILIGVEGQNTLHTQIV